MYEWLYSGYDLFAEYTHTELEEAGDRIKCPICERKHEVPCTRDAEAYPVNEDKLEVVKLLQPREEQQNLGEKRDLGRDSWRDPERDPKRDPDVQKATSKSSTKSPSQDKGPQDAKGASQQSSQSTTAEGGDDDPQQERRPVGSGGKTRS